MGRLSRRAGGAVVSMLVVVVFAAPAFASSSDVWLQDGHDAGHTFANLGESVLSPDVVANGLGVPSVDVGLIDVGPPLVSNGSVYVTSKAWDHYTGRLERWDIATEQRVWLTDMSCFYHPFL